MSSTHYRERHLCDLGADPYELNELADFAPHAEVRAGLRARLVARMVAAGESPPEIVPA